MEMFLFRFISNLVLHLINNNINEKKSSGLVVLYFFSLTPRNVYPLTHF